MKTTTLWLLIGSLLCGLWIWFRSLPDLKPILEMQEGQGGLAWLIFATLFGCAALCFSVKRSPLALRWRPRWNIPFFLFLLTYIVLHVPSEEGTAFLHALTTTQTWLGDTAKDTLGNLERIWSETRGARAPEDASSLWLSIGAITLLLSSFLIIPRRAIAVSTIALGGLSWFLISTFGQAEHLEIAGATVVAPFGIATATSAISRLFGERVRRAASVRQPGFRARILYAIGGTIAACVVWFYSVPELSPIIRPDWWTNYSTWVTLLAALLSGCLFVTFGTKYSPVALPMHIPVLMVPLRWPFLALFWFFATWFSVSIEAAVVSVAAYWVLSERLSIGFRKWALAIVSLGISVEFYHHLVTTFPPDATKRALVSVVAPFAIFWASGLPVVIPEYIKELSSFRALFVLGRGGSARFGGIFAFLTFDFTGPMVRPKKYDAPIYLGRSTFEQDPKIGCRHVGLANSDSMMLTVGAMGGGKSYASIWNTLCGPNGWPGGAFVLDPKGEHARRTGAIRSAINGVRSEYIDPWSIAPELYAKQGRSGFNPLEEIDLDSPNASSDLKQIAEACYLPQSVESENSKHFRENAMIVMVGVMAHILSTMPPEYHNLPSIYNAFLTGHPDAGAADPKAFDKMLVEMAVNESFSRAPMKAAKILTAAGENERGGFLTTVSSGLEWVIEDVFRPILMKSTFRMRNIKQQRKSVYLMVPFKKMQDEGVKRFMRLFVNFALWGCSAEADHNYSTLICLDEAAQLGTFKPIKEGLVTLRSVKAKIWLHFQNIQQIQERYSNWQDFMSSCDKQFFAVNDEATAKAISDFLGDYIEPSAEGRRYDSTRPLRSPAEILQDLRKGSGIQYVIPASGAPMRLKLVPFKRIHRRYGRT